MGIVHVRRFAVGTAMLAVVCNYFVPQVQAERVGFSYEGMLLQQPPDPLHPEAPVPNEFTLFGVSVSVGAKVRGTFSYDTTAVGVTASDGSRSFKQTITGGFTFNVFDSDNVPQLRVSASEYSMTAADNYAQPGVPGMIDYLSIDFNNKTIPAPPPLYVNGSVYTTTKTTLLRVPLSWDYPTFEGVDEPTLRPSLPNGAALFPFLGSVRSGTTASFDVSWLDSIGSTAGDYNWDGKVDSSDLGEWRKAFNKTSANYADGNGDGVVDGADYIVWRNAQGGLSAAAASVPEPTTLVFAVLLLLGLGIHRRSKSHANL